MKHITITLDDQELERLERQAAAQGITVDALVHDCLSGRINLPRVTTAEERAKARAKLAQLSETSPGRLGNWKWNRADIYADRLFPRHERTDLRGDRNDTGTG